LILSIRVFVFLLDCGFGYILFDFGYWLYSYIVVFVLSILGMVVFSLVCAILLTLRTRNRRGYRHPCIMDSPIHDIRIQPITKIKQNITETTIKQKHKDPNTQNQSKCFDGINISFVTPIVYIGEHHVHVDLLMDIALTVNQVEGRHNFNSWSRENNIIFYFLLRTIRYLRFYRVLLSIFLLCRQKLYSMRSKGVWSKDWPILFIKTFFSSYKWFTRGFKKFPIWNNIDVKNVA
jgi:hypothetical protein